MSIWNKILIGLIFVASVAFCYMAARTLKTHQHWRVMVQKYDREIAEFEKQNHDLVHADPPDANLEESGIVRLRLELLKTLVDRGRVWYNCKPSVDPQTGQAVVTTDFPDPHRISNKTILYVFEERDVDKSGKYLGEFRVTAVDRQKVVLKPTLNLPPEEMKNLENSRGTWSLYEIMPIDTRDALADLSDEEKKTLLPSSTVAEWLKQGKPSEADDPVDRVVDGKYQRLLRDYEVLFRWYHLQQTILADLYEISTRDLKYVKNSYDDALKQQQFREQQEQKLRAELAEYSRQRDAVAAMARLLQARVDSFRGAVERLIAQNLAVAAQIAKYQLEAARQIDAKTRAMARAPAESRPTSSGR